MNNSNAPCGAKEARQVEGAAESVRDTKGAVAFIEPSTPLHRFRLAMQNQKAWPSVMMPQHDARLLLKLTSAAEELSRAGGDGVDYWIEEIFQIMQQMTDPTPPPAGTTDATTPQLDPHVNGVSRPENGER